ncbi:PREDICTED: pro-neuregulin-1, membrane-bound isoform-like, partial [Tauraco erythrolophus]|uniref:pro-neuregulin-1, membrane-bound isoform-like n=1 Tax=Tauraco erythrolophus TaxID=121530 RepID=UPI000523A99F
VPPKLKEMKNQEAAVGQKLVLRCETTSEYPALRFKWLKNGKEITKKNRPENIKIPKKQKKYSELHIYRATLADAGEYACRVSSKLGNDSTKASVIITDTNGDSFLEDQEEGKKQSSFKKQKVSLSIGFPCVLDHVCLHAFEVPDHGLTFYTPDSYSAICGPSNRGLRYSPFLKRAPARYQYQQKEQKLLH